MSEPRVRKDGRCALARCRKPRGEFAVAHGDPFCSSLCCREHYGVKFKTDETSVEARKRRAQPS